MKQLKVRCGCSDYLIIIDTKESLLKFSVYPIVLLDDEDEHSFCDKHSSDTVEKFDESKIRIMFKGSYCWRGVWEGRICFTDNEYWDHEISEINELFNKHIEPWCKQHLRDRLNINPNHE